MNFNLPSMMTELTEDSIRNWAARAGVGCSNVTSSQFAGDQPYYFNFTLTYRFGDYVRAYSLCLVASDSLDHNTRRLTDIVHQLVQPPPLKIDPQELHEWRKVVAEPMSGAVPAEWFRRVLDALDEARGEKP